MPKLLQLLPGMLLTRTAQGAPQVGDAPPRSIDEIVGRDLKRFFKVGNINEEKRTVELSFSSEIEAERWGFVEVLDHSEEAVDLSRLNDGAPLLFNHDLDRHLGVVESASISERKGRAVVRFDTDEDSEKVWRKVKAGSLRNVSVGYRINEIKLVETRENGVDVYKATRWQPYEISMVTVPLDPTVGVGRGRNSNSQKPENTTMNRATIIAELNKRGIQFSETATDAELQALLNGAGTRSAAQVTHEPPPAPNAPNAATAERDRVRSILEAGKQYGEVELAQDAAASGKSLDEFRRELLEKKHKTAARANDPIGLSEKEAENFSMIRLIGALAAEKGTERRMAERAAFELEACRAAADMIKHREVKGSVIPLEVLVRPLKRSTNTISVGLTSTGYNNTAGNVVETNKLFGSFIDLLRNRSTIMSLGTPLGGLMGNYEMPKQLTGSAGYWIGEDGEAQKDDLTLGLVTLQPKTVANYGEITRRALMQPSMDVEALFRADQARGLATTIDLAGYYGDGTGNAPVGIKSTNGINSVDFAATNPTFAELVAMETAISADNADVPAMAYVSNPAFRGYAKTNRRIGTSTDSNTIWEPGNTVNGYRTEITNQIASGDVFFGNFADLIIGMWGGLEITVDPFTHSTRGRIRIVAMQDLSFVVRRAESFCWGSAAVTP